MEPHLADRSAPYLSTVLRSDAPIDLVLTLHPLCRGRHDPTMRISTNEVWRATRTRQGPATTRLVARSDGIAVDAWGEGAAQALEDAPALVGFHDRRDDFDPRDRLVRDLHRRFAGLRIPRTGAVTEALVPTILEQKVVGAEARASYASLVRRLGERAPGPAGLLLPPEPGRLARTPSWLFHEAGVERRRADTVRNVALMAHRIDETSRLALPDAYARLRALPGVGPWTVAKVAGVALGDADAVPVGDFHLPNAICWALAAQARGDDTRMLALLDQFRPHRGRVIRLLAAAGMEAPRRGPRMPLRLSRHDGSLRAWR